MPQTVNCPNCGNVNVALAEFCTACGKKLPADAQAAPGLSIGGLATDDSEFPMPAGPKTTKTKRMPQLETSKLQRPAPPAEGRMSFESLAKRYPGRPYLAVLGTREPPQGYLLRDPIVTVGRGPDNAVTVQDDRMSRAHVLFALVGHSIVAIDLRSKTGAFVNGRRIEQVRLQVGDVIRCGHTEMVFAFVPGADAPWGYELCALWSPNSKSLPEDGGDSRDFKGDVEATADESDSAGPAASLVVEDKASGRRAVSAGLPVLIGSDANCHVKLDGDGIAAFHAQVYWSDTGPRVRDLGATAGTLLNGEPITDAALDANASVSLASAELAISLHGDVPALARALAAPRAPRPLAVTCVSGPAQGVSATLPACDRKLILGRSRNCDLHMEDPRASSKHVSLLVGADTIAVEDLGSRNGIRINGQDAKAGELRLGDCLTVGKSEFLVHRAV